MKRAAGFSTGRLAITPAGFVDALSLQRCLEACADYFERAEGRAVGAHDAEDLIGEAEVDSERPVFLIREKATGDRVGVLDLALQHPAPAEATISLLIFVPARRRRGLGGELVSSLLEWLSGAGFVRAQLGVKPGADGAAEFWENQGFSPSGAEDGIRLFEKPLKTR